MYKVYYTSTNNDSAHAMTFNRDQMTEALGAAQSLRNNGYTFVTIVCENSDQVGKMGVSAVENGRLPDGTDYNWRKRR